MLAKRTTWVDFSQEIMPFNMDGYEFFTLYSLKRILDSGSKILLTKGGGLWPILLANIYETYELSENELQRGLTETFERIEKYPFEFIIDPPRPKYVMEIFIARLLIEDPVNWVHRVIRLYNTTIFKLERKEMIKDPYQGNTVTITEDLAETSNQITESGMHYLQRITEERVNRSHPHSDVRNLINYFLNLVVERTTI